MEIFGSGRRHLKRISGSLRRSGLHIAMSLSEVYWWVSDNAIEFPFQRVNFHFSMICTKIPAHNYQIISCRLFQKTTLFGLRRSSDLTPMQFFIINNILPTKKKKLFSVGFKYDDMGFLQFSEVLARGNLNSKGSMAVLDSNLTYESRNSYPH